MAIMGVCMYVVDCTEVSSYHSTPESDEGPTQFAADDRIVGSTGALEHQMGTGTGMELEMGKGRQGMTMSCKLVSGTQGSTANHNETLASWVLSPAD